MREGEEGGERKEERERESVTAVMIYAIKTTHTQTQT